MNYKKLLVYAPTKAIFETALANSVADQNCVAYIEEPRMIWAQGNYYPCPYTKEEIDQLIQNNKDEFEQIITELKGNVTEEYNTLEKIENKIKEEVTRAQQKETELDTKIEAETTRAQDAENALDQKLDEETERAKSAESTLDQKLGEEIDRAKEAEQTLTEGLDEANESIQDIRDTYLPLSQKGVEIATLGSDGKLTASQLPALKTINNESVVGSGNITIDLSLYKLVTTLPTQNIDSNKIYLVKSAESESQDTYSEYIYLTESSTWEKLGTYKSDVDLSPYVKFTDIESQLSDISTKPVQNKIIKSALDDKSDVGHKHNISDVNNLQATLDGKSPTSHTHANFRGATALAAGTAGFVPAPVAGDNNSKYLKADGTWAVPPNTTYSVVTQTSNGLMTKEDKIKLDGIQQGANKTVVDSVLSSSSTNPVQNKIINSALAGKANTAHNHDSSYVQAVAVSGNNLQITKNNANTTITIPYATKANQLNTARTIWGQSFNGTQNITGSLSGVTQITANGGIATNWADVWNDGTYDHPWYGLDLRNNYGVNANPYCQTLSGYFGMCFKTSQGLISFLQNGNVGIGKNNPSTTLDVNGTIKGTTLQGNLAWSYITGAPTVFRGATSSAAGSTGLVPAPAAGAQAKYLRADGTWQTPPDTNTTYGLATTSANGLLRQLNGNASYYLNGTGNWSVPPTYTHPSYINAGEGLYKITVQNGHVTKVTGVTKSDITALGIPGQDTNTTYNIATASVAGLVKPVSVITKPTLQPVTTTGGKYYQVQMSNDGNMFVNVPWTAGSSITVDSVLNNYSINPVQNKVLYNALGGKADSGHTHQNFIIKLNGGTTEGTNQFTYNGGTAKTVNVTPASIGAASSSHTHNYLPLTGGTLTGGLVCDKAGENSLYVNGQSQFLDRVYMDDELYVKVYIETQGSITANSFYESSDRSLKKNIKSISNSDLEKIKKVELKEFNFKEDSTKKYGVIAQEIEEVGLNNLVSKNREGMKSVDYISLLILKIQQLEEEIKELKYGK